MEIDILSLLLYFSEMIHQNVVVLLPGEAHRALQRPRWHSFMYVKTVKTEPPEDEVSVKFKAGHRFRKIFMCNGKYKKYSGEFF